MKKDYIDFLVTSGQLRVRQTDMEKVKSMLLSAETNVGVVKNIPLTNDSATLIFREMYESIRQLGDAQWWLLGYEPLNHEVSMEILKEMDIKNKIRLNYLSRFRKIRNDINYRGFRADISQAQEILDFWDVCGKDIAGILLRQIQANRFAINS